MQGRVYACVHARMHVCVHVCVRVCVCERESTRACVCTGITILLEPIKENIVGFFPASSKVWWPFKKKKRSCANGILNNQFVLQGY